MAALAEVPRLEHVRPRAGPAAALGRGVRLALGRPSLWPVTLVGFLARGGLILLWLPLLVLPGPVGLATLVGPDLLDANGVSARVQVLLTVAALLVAGLIWLALVASSAADAAAIEGFTPATGPTAAGPSAEGSSPVARRGRAARAWLVVELALLQALLLVPAALAAVPAAVAVIDAVRQELLVPTRLDVPLAIRVLEGSWQPLLVVLLLAAVGESLYARVAREVVLTVRPSEGSSVRRGAVAKAAARGLARLGRRPVPHLLADAVGWATIGAAVLLGYGALTAAWPVVMAAYLPASSAGNAGLAVGIELLVTVGLVALLGAVLVVLAAASAVRSALLTGAALHGRETEGWSDA